MYEKHWKIFFLHFGVWHFVAFVIYCCPFVHFSVWDFKGTDNCLLARVFSFRAKSGNFSATSHCVMSWQGLTWHFWYYATMVLHYHGTTPRYHGTIPRFHMVLLSFWDFLGSKHCKKQSCPTYQCNVVHHDGTIGTVLEYNGSMVLHYHSTMLSCGTIDFLRCSRILTP